MAKTTTLTKTIVKWINRFGENRQHTLFNRSHNEAREWFKTSILDCQGVLTHDEKRDSKLQLLEIKVLSEETQTITLKPERPYGY